MLKYAAESGVVRFTVETSVKTKLNLGIFSFLHQKSVSEIVLG